MTVAATARGADVLDRKQSLLAPGGSNKASNPNPTLPRHSCSYTAPILQALLPVIRESLYLSRHDVGNSGIAAVCGAIASRVMMGNMVDMYGPRFGYSFLLLLTAPAIYCMALVTGECAHH